jgi:hypothetical protein
MAKTDRVKQYKVVFDDGTIQNVHGCWAAHAWAVARELWPNKNISSLQLLESTNQGSTVA